MNNAHRRKSTIAHEAAEVLLEEAEKTVLEDEKEEKLTIHQRFRDIRGMVYNPEYREFLSRDAAGWFKLAICYFIFYIFLASFFILMLLIFYQIIDLNTPTYYNEDSVMSYRGVNPGLGFRPQLDPESELIKVDAQKFEENKKSIQIFLSNYEKLKDETFSIEGKGKSNRKLSFNYKEIIKDTPCSEKNDFGYKSNPCVIVKLNKIYGWTPKTEKKPENLNLTDSVLAKDAIYVTCSGDGGVDRDNIKEIEYYSLLDSREVGGIPVEYFPYQNQKNYLSPLVFVHFKQVEKNTLINIVCKAHAENIDNSDRINQRGMVRFQLFVESKP